MAKNKTTSERGKFKEEINKALYQSSDIKELLLGDISGMSTTETITAFKDHVKSHLFIDDTIDVTDTYIYYDVVFPRLKAEIKECKVIMYAICHRSILDDYSKDGFFGNRADILIEMIENALINNKETSNNFGIGEIRLDSIDVYSYGKMYGSVLTFEVPSFR